MQRKNRKLTEKILELYPSGECALEFSDAFELLVASRLSAQCTDVRVNIVTSEMFKKLKTPEDYAEADITEIENYILRTLPYQGSGHKSDVANDNRRFRREDTR